MYQFPGFTIIFVISTALCFVSAAMLWQRRVNPGSISFSLLMLSLTTWSFASIFEAGAMTVDGKIFWSKWQYIGITTIAPLWLHFVADYTRKINRRSWLFRYGIWIIPFITFVLAVTNEYHQLIWTNVTVMDEVYFIAHYEHGIAYFIHLIYSYIMLLFGTIWLILEFFRSEKTRRNQLVIFLVSVILGLFASLIYNLRLFPIPEFDITPVTISFIALILSWTIFRFHVFNLVPIARESLLSSMQDGVIVIDPNDKILEINPAALEITGYSGLSLVGQSIWYVFEKYQDEIESLRNRTNFIEELVLPGDEERTVEIQVTSIEQDGNDLTGQLIVLRDITEEKRADKIEKEQKAFVEALADTAAVINKTLDLDEVLERILENVIKVVPHESANIALMTEKGMAKFVKVKNPEKYSEKDYLTGLDINVLNIANFRKMAETGQPIIVSDTRKNGQWTNSLEESLWIRSFLGAPIISQGEVLGFIDLDSSRKNAFTKAHADRLAIFAEYAATAISNARNYAEIKFYAEEMAILYEVSLAIAAGVGLEKTTQAVFRQLKRVIPVDLFYLALYEPMNNIVSYFMYRGNGERVEIEPFNLMTRKSMTRHVIEKKENVYIPDFKADNAELNKTQVILIPDYDGRTALGIPLILRGEVIGVLSVQSEKANAYSERQIRLVDTIAQQATIAMDNAKLFERMQQLAITDGLTKIYNRRYFYLILKNEIERAMRYEKPLSMIMMDIDHFKRVNDQYGHLAGDEVLEAIAGLSKNLLRQTDEIFRYGGEEFTILLPETNSDLALSVAERIRRTIAETKFNTKKDQIQITVSLGVTQFEDSFSTPREFIEVADKALYSAKKAGRNCVRMYPD